MSSTSTARRSTSSSNKAAPGYIFPRGRDALTTAGSFFVHHSVDHRNPFWTFPPVSCTIPLPMPGLFSDPRQLAVVLLFGGGLGLLLSVMFATRAINFELDTTPTRRIFAHWLPIVAAVFLATILRQGEIAVAIIFGTSVAMLSVVTGFVAMAGPLIEVPAHARRVWPFLPVLATLIFVL